MTDFNLDTVKQEVRHIFSLPEGDRRSRLKSLPTELRAAVVDYIRRHQQRSAPPQTAEEVTPETKAVSVEAAGQQYQPENRIGPFRILKKLNEGGMGVVYLAEQTSPVRRDVALKVIRQGLDSKEFLARFESERQALALMDHPNIAKVLDAGASESGLPYFAMEYVRGLPISEFCLKRNLNLSQRLRLFVAVCRAIQHAHQKGVIHRDIKPTNILVEEIDGNPVPKVIDFGLAKTLHHRLSDKTYVTRAGYILGTPEYMSPEQASLNPNDIDTRTDIYSLGIVLYELLTGSTPVARERLSEDWACVARLIREEEPKRPSQRIGSSLNSIESTSSSAQKKFIREIRGDLDRITMKAIEKDRSRRYDSAGAFADDVERFLRGEIVSARSPSFAYISAKLIRRYRHAAILMVAVFLMTLISLAASLRGLLTERSARLQVEAAQQVLRQQNYFANIEQAGQRLREGNVEDAQRLLRLCPKDLRGWEHQYLSELSDESDAVIAVHADGIQSMDVSASGDRVITVSRSGNLSVVDVPARRVVASTDVTVSAPQKIVIESSQVLKAFCDDVNQRLVICGQDGWVHILESADFRVISKFQGFAPATLKAVELCLHGSGLAVLSEDSIIVWDIGRQIERSPVVLRRIAVECSDTRHSTAPAIAIHPDGFHAAVFREYGQVVDLNTGRALQVVDVAMPNTGTLLNLRRELPQNGSLVFSRDGVLLASRQQDSLSIVQGLESNDQRTIATSESGLFDISSVDFHSSGEFLSCGLSNGQLVLYESRDGYERRRLNGHSMVVTGLESTNDGSSLFSSSMDGTIRLWDLSRPDFGQTFFSSGGCGTGGQLWLDDQSKTLLRKAQRGSGFELHDAVSLERKGFVLTPDSYTLLEGTSFSIWSLADPNVIPGNVSPEIRTFLLENDFIRVQETGELLPIVDRRSAARSSTSEKDTTTKGSEAKPRTVAVPAPEVAPAPAPAPAAAVADVAAEGSLPVSVNDIAVNRLDDVNIGGVEDDVTENPRANVETPVAVPEIPSGFAVTSNGKYLAISSVEGEACLVDLEKRQTVWESQKSTSGAFARFAMDDRWLLLTGSETRIVSMSDFKVRLNDSEVTASALSKDGSQFALARSDDRIRVINLETDETNLILGARLRISAMDFSADGKSIFTGTDDGTMRLWDIQSGREIGIVHDEVHPHPFNSIVFSSVMRCIYAVDCEDRVYRWGIASPPNPEDTYQFLGMTRTQRIPQASREQLIGQLPKLRTLLSTGKFSLESDDPAAVSIDYRVIWNSVLRLSELDAWGAFSAEWKTSQVIRQILDRESSRPTTSFVDAERKSLALYAQYQMFGNLDFDQLLGDQVEEQVSELVIALLLRQKLPVDAVFAHLESGDRAVLCSRLLRLIADGGADLTEKDADRLKSIAPKLLLMPDNRVRANLLRLLQTQNHISTSEIIADIPVPGRFPPVNKTGLPMAYFIQKGDHLTSLDVAAAEGNPASVLAVSMTEVTEAEYDQFLRKTGGVSKLPRTDVTVVDMANFCNWLNENERLPHSYSVHESGAVLLQESSGYRLLLDSEWRMLTSGADIHQNIPVSEQLSHRHFGSRVVNPMNGRSAPVTNEPPDRFGMFGLSSNVSDACWLTSSSDGTVVAGFGGCFWGRPSFSESTALFNVRPVESRSDLGFRVARVIDRDESEAPEFTVRSLEGKCFVTSVTNPTVRTTSFGTRVVFRTKEIREVPEEQLFTYQVTQERPETRTRTVPSSNGEVVEEEYTILVPVTEERQAARTIIRRVIEFEDRFADFQEPVEILQNASTDELNGLRDLTDELTWRVDSEEAGLVRVILQSRSDADSNEFEEIRLEVPSDLYVPLDYQAAEYSIDLLPKEFKRVDKRDESLGNEKND